MNTEFNGQAVTSDAGPLCSLSPPVALPDGGGGRPRLGDLLTSGPRMGEQLFLSVVEAQG